MTATTTPQLPRPRTRIAVFGSLSKERPVNLPPGDPPLSPAARAVLERVLDSIASSAPSIAQPILDRAVEEGTITRAERHELLRELRDPADVPAPGPVVSLAAHRILREALIAIRRAAPGIAQPILAEAVDAERLTAAQQRRILERLRTGPARGLRGAAQGPFGAHLAGGVSSIT
jgi:hypothetical protein